MLPILVQVAVLKRKQARPALNFCDRLFWVMLRRFWLGWKQALVIVPPDTVVAGIGQASGGTGGGDLAAILADPRSPAKFGT